MYDPITFRLRGLADGDYVVATLYQTRCREHPQAGRGLSRSSRGTWVTLPGETGNDAPAPYRPGDRHMEVPDYESAVPDDVTRRTWIIRIGYPVHSFGGQIPLMLTTVHGNISAAGRIKLIDLDLPRAYCDQFRGPRFGIEGLRELLGIPRRPLLHVMIKPSIGLSPEESAELFYQGARGGVDCIKDDELVMSHPWSDYLDRVRLHKVAAERADAEKGEKTLYFVNVTDRPDHDERAKRAIGTPRERTDGQL
jgi:2,3-diketo-5-methylthiopentyl-1-phosphate enolase